MFSGSTESARLDKVWGQRIRGLLTFAPRKPLCLDACAQAEGDFLGIQRIFWIWPRIPNSKSSPGNLEMNEDELLLLGRVFGAEAKATSDDDFTPMVTPRAI